MKIKAFVVIDTNIIIYYQSTTSYRHKIHTTAIAYDDNMHSMADLFNKAADEYLKKQEKNGGKNQ